MERFQRDHGFIKLSNRVIPLRADATQLPFPYSCFDYVLSVDAVRSFKNKETIIQIFKEMLRVTKKEIFIAVTSPDAKNKAQKAHISMYNLRYRLFKDDLHYFKPEEMKMLLKKAGAKKIKIKIIEVNCPYHLAFFRKETIAKVKNVKKRKQFESLWERAKEELDKYGEESPPVIIIHAEK